MIRVQIKIVLEKLKPEGTPASPEQKQIEQVQFETLVQVVWALTDPCSALDASIRDSLLLCLPCFAKPREFVSVLTQSYENAPKYPHRKSISHGSSGPKAFLRQQKVR